VAFREWVEKVFLDFRPYHDSYLRLCGSVPAAGCSAVVD